MKMDLRSRAALAAVLLGVSVAASAGVNTWSSIGPNGGEVRKVVYHKGTPTTVYMIAAGGFYRSLDAGATWQLLKSDFLNTPTDFEVDPTDQSRVYVVSQSPQTMVMSTDAGATFSTVAFPNVGNVFEIEVSADGKTLYAVSGVRVFRSDDRGDTWQERAAVGTANGTPVRMVIDPTDKDTVYVHAPTSPSSAALYVTRDGALTWAPLSAAAPAGYLFDIAVPASNPARIWIAGENGLYVSSNSGLNFSPSFSPPTADAASVIAINPADPTNLFIAEPYGHVYRTINEGATWVDVSGNVTAGQPQTIALRPMQTTPHVLVGGLGGLSLSTVGGTTWAPRETGFTSTRISSLSADPTSDRVYVSVSGGGVHYVSGGGDSTTAVDNTKLRQLTQIPTSFGVPAVLAQDGAPGRLFASLDNRIARSLDGGSNWTLTGFPLLPAIQARSLTSSPGNPQVILAGIVSSLYRTADGGDTWAPAITGLPAGSYVEVVSFAPSDPLVAYAVPNVTAPVGQGQSFGVYRSTNAGLTWSAANTGIETLPVVGLAVDPTNAQIVYASGASKLWKTTNGGSSWVELSWPSQQVGYPTALAVDPLHPQILYASGFSAVARSINRGESWEFLRAAQTMPLWLPDEVLPDPRRPHVLLVGTQKAGVQQMTIAPDLSLELDAPATPVPVGFPVTHTYTVHNLGPFHATGVKLALQMPATAQDVAVTTSAGSCTAPGPTITCSLDVVRASFTATVTLRATPSAAGPFQIAATVQGDQADVSADNNTQTRNATAAQLSDLSVTATGPASAQVGSTVSFTLTVGNTGPNAAPDVQVGYQLGSGLTPAVVTTTVGTCAVNAGLITCTLGNLAVGAAATINVSANAATAGAQISTASLTTGATDLAVANNVATVNTSVTAAPAPSNPNPPASSGGGGGSLSAFWLLFLGLFVAWRLSRNMRAGYATTE
jgi:uncharacterized repeat protein (TIGR01451 family)